MTALTYTVLTDPAPLEASAAGRQSKSIGTVHLIVTNTARRTDWSAIEVRVPVGDGAGDLSPNITEMKGTYTENQWGGQAKNRKVSIERQQGSNIFKVTPQADGTASFVPGDHMVLTLENFTVASTPGPAVLTVREKTEDDDGEHTRYTSVALVKTAPKEIPAPRDFRPDKSMVDTGENLTLSWEGSADLTYEIVFPGGRKTVSGGTWSPPAPTRATTYILVATDPQTQRRHFLTTTVQVRHPVLETLTATAGVDTPWVQGTENATKGRITFTGTGAQITGNSGGQGTIQADKADLNGVNTEWVQGRSADDGWITFPKEGLHVHRKDGSKLTHLVVGYATLDIVKTRIVRGLKDDDGWISFRREGLNIHRERGMDRGTLFAADTDLTR
ncbi:hypothetical protein OG320_19930 [Microbispora sp. NBC_01189]|uniref:hypothetical protein n=1 Tax=Microbispora sp. NBC_01189 TaxID=2903583 RepID=UPI002E125F86|nr:hypothetical protein OG320_19930 [Microbispora sp. NBC_01189]